MTNVHYLPWVDPAKIKERIHRGVEEARTFTHDHLLLMTSAAFVVGLCAGILLSKKGKSTSWDRQFTGPVPRNQSAISAVSGGPPEDLNGMPATEDPDREGPIYDGSQLGT